MTSPASEPAPLQPPADLLDNPEALAFWNRHASGLVASDMLSVQDVDSFALLCRIWSHLKTLEEHLDPNQPAAYRHWLDLARQYASYCRQFGLTPAERKRQRVVYGTGDNLTRYDGLDEFLG